MQAGPASAPSTTTNTAPTPGPVAVPPSIPPAKAADETSRPDRATMKEDALDKLRQDVDRIKDQLVRSRARAKTLDRMVHGTAVALHAQYDADRHFVLRELEITLDGARLFELGSAGLPDVLKEVTRTAASPGLHTLTVRLNLRARGNDRLGYRSEQSFAVEVPEGKPIRIEVAIDEDGSLPSYEPKLEVRIREGS